jgi:hypothetical protein
LVAFANLTLGSALYRPSRVKRLAARG